ncbi:polysaccharide deacetylase family protein [Mesorhizobium sp. M1307]|uniref:polysaccharide deacetylase family protein n=1 Tax=Mesorhizobium sp. M1307 TaxID=2957079 RepID=UPI0033388E07
MNAAGSSKRIVLHEDDVGMCHGANSAFLELSGLGVCSSGAVMVPCPWFLEMAESAAANPALDLGVHLTLNSEKQHYKWRPLTAPSRAAGLTDEFGFFWPDVATTRRKAVPQAVEAELRAQIDTAYRAGIDVTHLDAHMGAALSPEFCNIYIKLGLEYQLPVLLTKTLSAYSPNDNLVGVTEEAFQRGVALARAGGFAIFDAAIQTTWGRPRSRPIEPAYKALIDGSRLARRTADRRHRHEAVARGASRSALGGAIINNSPRQHRGRTAIGVGKGPQSGHPIRNVSRSSRPENGARGIGTATTNGRIR